MAISSDGLVQLVEIRHMKTINESDLLADIRNSGEQSTPILPIGCRLYREGADSRGGSDIIRRYTIERPPQILRPYVRGGRDPDTGDRRPDFQFEIAIPFTIYTFRVGRDNSIPTVPLTYWTTKPVTSISDPMYLYAFPNHYSNADQAGQACFGSEYDGIRDCRRSDGSYDLSKYVEYTDNYIMASRFNADLGDGNLLSSIQPVAWSSMDLASATEEELPEKERIMGAGHFVKAMARAHLWTARSLNPLIDILSLRFNTVTTVENAQ